MWLQSESGAAIIKGFHTSEAIAGCWPGPQEELLARTPINGPFVLPELPHSMATGFQGHPKAGSQEEAISSFLI